jgi:hypothetical protein
LESVNLKAASSLREASACPSAPSDLWQEKQAQLYVHNSELLNAKIQNTVSKYFGQVACGLLKAYDLLGFRKPQLVLSISMDLISIHSLKPKDKRILHTDDTNLHSQASSFFPN